MVEHPAGSGDPHPSSDEAQREERERHFTRRRILEVGWTVPVIALTNQMGGQIRPSVPPLTSHADGGHSDLHYHEDLFLHNDVDSYAHGDVLHEDRAGEEWDHVDQTERGMHYDGGHEDTTNHHDSGHYDSAAPHADYSIHSDRTAHFDVAHFDHMWHIDADD